jgi:phage shock protein A
MALLERVSALIRANLNDLVDKAEEPEKMLKQIILDMENQLMQVKTQVAVALADEHLLARKQKENDARIADWMRKAELAVDRRDDELARGALERAETYRRLTDGFEEQIAEQKTQTDTLRNALRRLEQKMSEARAKSDLLIAQHRRSRAVRKATEAHLAISADHTSAAFDRMKNKVLHVEAVAVAHNELMVDSLDDRFAAIERGDRIDQLLAELKAKRLTA